MTTRREFLKTTTAFGLLPSIPFEATHSLDRGFRYDTRVINDNYDNAGSLYVHTDKPRVILYTPRIRDDVIVHVNDNGTVLFLIRNIFTGVSWGTLCSFLSSILRNYATISIRITPTNNGYVKFYLNKYYLMGGLTTMKNYNILQAPNSDTGAKRYKLTGLPLQCKISDVEVIRADMVPQIDGIRVPKNERSVDLVDALEEYFVELP